MLDRLIEDTHVQWLYCTIRWTFALWLCFLSFLSICPFSWSLYKASWLAIKNVDIVKSPCVYLFWQGPVIAATWHFISSVERVLPAFKPRRDCCICRKDFYGYNPVDGEGRGVTGRALKRFRSSSLARRPQTMQEQPDSWSIVCAIFSVSGSHDNAVVWFADQLGFCRVV